MRIAPIPIPFILLAACTPSTPPPAVAPPAPVAAPAPPPAPPAPADWRDAPLTPGTWHYLSEKTGSSALFGAELFRLRCDKASAQIRLSGANIAPLGRITTSFGTDTLAAALNPRDPVLDRIAFSRGRFMVETAGARLILPAWPEFARVVEDCRG